MGAKCDNLLSRDGRFDRVHGCDGVSIRTINFNVALVHALGLVAPDRVIDVLHPIRCTVPCIKNNDFTTIGETALAIDRAGQSLAHIANRVGRTTVFVKFVGWITSMFSEEAI